MEISEVKVKLMGERSDRLKAFCSITIDREFVIRDLKIIEGANGMFVAMPSRKITDKCQACGGKNHLRAKYCAECGSRLNENRAGRDAEGRTKLHADIAHPINSACREKMQKRIIRCYEEEKERAKMPGYKPSYQEEFEDEEFAESDAVSGAPQKRVDERREESTLPPRDGGRAADGGDDFGAGIL